MTDIVDFKAKSHLNAVAQVNAFIDWAKETLPKGIPDRVHAGIRWELESWHQHGIHNCAFTALVSTKNARKNMQPPFTDFAKAMVVYRRLYQTKKSVQHWRDAMKALEAALVELTGTRDVTRLSAVVCNRACEKMQSHWTRGNAAYISSKSLEQIITLMKEKELLKTNFRWTSPLKQKPKGTLKAQKANREQKLPSPEAIKALGEVFNNDLTSPLDIVVTSACAFLLSAPSRIGELADIQHDCVVFKEGTNGNRRMFLRWYAEKINRPMLKPVVKPEMESVIERAITLLKPITDDARAYAAWLEDHPDQFPPHEGLPQKGPDDPLTYSEACAALKVSMKENARRRPSPRTIFKHEFLKPFEKRKALGPAAQAILCEIRKGWDAKGKRIFAKGKQGIQRCEFNDRFEITLRKLNVLLREKYLPKDFPYTTPYTEGKARVKYRDALFTVRTGTLPDETTPPSEMRRDFGVEIAAKPHRIAVQLAGGPVSSIFERYGYVGVTVRTHAFRHELNTEMHRAGLSQLLIDAFSGRTAMGSVYNHETIEERTQAVAAYHPKTKHSNAAQRLEKVRTNEPLSLSDVRDLHESEQDRVIHQSHIGICVHDFAAESCPKMGACLTCGNLGCVKGDDVKLANLKEEREDLKRRYDKALDAQSRGIFGASQSVKKVGTDLFKCASLIRTLESPELENGNIVWNVDNGWTLANNAAAMAGLIDAKVIEAKNEQQALPSLDELSAMLDEIEV